MNGVQDADDGTVNLLNDTYRMHSPILGCHNEKKSQVDIAFGTVVILMACQCIHHLQYQGFMKLTASQNLPKSYVSTKLRQFSSVFVVARLTPYFHSQYTPVSLQFVPLLQAYFVPEDFYREGEVLTMPIPSEVALQVDIHSLSKDHNYSVFIDSTNKARIQ